MATTAAAESTRVRSSESLLAADGQPLLYPEPIFVKNTFIGLQEERPPSLDGFFMERQVFSCPASAVLLEPEVAAARTPVSSDDFAQEDKASQCSLCDTLSTSSSFLHAGSPRAQAPVQLRLEAALFQPAVHRTQVGEGAEVATAEATKLPSVGSAGHFEGTCKPCAFLHTKGCDSGSACEFCHMCGPEARRQRKQEKRAFFGALKHMRRLMASGTAARDAAGVPAHGVSDQLRSSMAFGRR